MTSHLLPLVAGLAFMFGVPPTQAATQLQTIRYVPDISIGMGSVTVGGNAVAEEDLSSRSVGLVPVGPFPAGSRIIAYHTGTEGQLFAFDTTLALPGGIVARPGDVVRFDGTNYEKVFDADLRGVPSGVMTDAVALAADGDLLLSFDVSVSLGGTTYGPEDLIRFDGSSSTSFLDGSAAGVSSGLNLDGAQLLPNGHLLLSFDGSGAIGVLTFNDEDILEYNPGVGTWEMAYQGATRPQWGPADLVAFSAVPQPPRADIAMAKAAPATLILGSNLTYGLTLSNNGPDEATNVTMVDTLPAGASYVSVLPSQGSCAVSGSTITCTLPNLASGAAATVTLAVQPTAEATITNTATVTALEADPDPSNNSATATTVVTLGQPRITAAVAAKGIQSQTATQKVVYLDVRLTNTGTGHARNLKITSLPVRTLAGAGTISYNTALSPSLPITVGDLNVGEAKTTRLYFTVPKTVTRFSVTESGTLQNVVGTSFNYSAVQSVMP